MKLLNKHSIKLLLLSMTFWNHASFAGAFQLWEEDATGTGDFHAGYAAEANYPGTEFYNPAGMTHFNHLGVSTGAVYFPLRTSYTGNVIINGTSSITYQSINEKGNTNRVVPNLHLVVPINSRMAFGFGVTTPFGLETSYPYDNSIVGYAGTLTRLMTINVNPSVAFKIAPKVSVGLGVDYMNAKAIYNAEIPIFNIAFTNLLTAPATWGWNMGALFELNNLTRVGFAYRSGMRLHGKGASEISASGVVNSDNLQAILNLPPTYSLSFYSDVAPRWTVLATANYSLWNVFSSIPLQHLATITGVPLIPESLTVQQNYRNSWMVSVGTHVKLTDAFMLKAGVGYDQTPTQTGYRDTRLPDADKVALALGFHTMIHKMVGFDFGWTHFFHTHIPIDNTQSGNLIFTSGYANNAADVVGAEVSVIL